MEKILELGDSYDDIYPQHFQVFLDNCLKTYEGYFGANDYLFAAVYFIILETGFSPVGLADDSCAHDSVDFDIRKISSVTGYKEDQIRISDNSVSKKCFIYRIPLNLGKYCSSMCELQGVPSGEVNTHLIINFLSKEPHAVKSLCLNTDTYIKRNETSSRHKYLLKNLKALSLKVKNNVSVQIKNLILTNEEEGCSANLLCIPEEIQKKIIYFLSDEPCSVQALSSTCTYFYSFIKSDTKLWEDMCFREFSGWELNKALQESCVRGDVNVFRTAFFYLKTKKFVGNLCPTSAKGLSQTIQSAFNCDDNSAAVYLAGHPTADTQEEGGAERIMLNISRISFFDSDETEEREDFMTRK